MPRIIYQKSVFLVVENTLSDNSKTYDIHAHTDGFPSSMLLYMALSEADAISRCDRLCEALS